MSLATPTIIDGKLAAARVRDGVSKDVSEMVADARRPPGLATILIGEDPASAVYVAAKRKACADAGIRSFHHELPATVSREDVLALIDRLNADDDVSGILCQLPLPQHLDPLEITNRISAEKDVDGLTVASAGRLALGLPGLRPCTPAGVMLLLAEAGVELRGALAVVLGRSNLFGKPMGQMLLAADATVVAAHRCTRDTRALCRQADVLVAAVGRPGLVRADWVRPGATVIDVGINRTEGGLVGDVDFDAVAPLAGAITPVPGGVGPMTIACLLRNTLIAARG
ncbi:MAG TPA: bifunctional methylenetetrahydrofolate dehydrogenase/methenyltetrahydrofolate cyclohydrolase FolD [Baekduia sp.]|nr:bifunctional methylenetetrahydrofolate dehydrogenase/methenyltetrahydrofolate cyclohydrolase FolD [Baekduia sp.]